MQELIDNLPTMLAVQLKRYRDTGDSYGKMWRLCFFVELTYRLMFFLLRAQLHQDGCVLHNTLKRDLWKFSRSLTFGSVCKLTKRMAKTEGAHPTFMEFVATLDKLFPENDSDFDIVAIRNEFGHRDPWEEQARQRLEALEPGLKELFQKIRWMFSLEIVGRNDAGVLWLLRGDDPYGRRMEAGEGFDRLENESVIARLDGREWVLWPLLRYGAAGETGDNGPQSYFRTHSADLEYMATLPVYPPPTTSGYEAFLRLFYYESPAQKTRTILDAVWEKIHEDMTRWAADASTDCRQRDDELRLLSNLPHRDGAVTMLYGHPRVGKSTLMGAFAKALLDAQEESEVKAAITSPPPQKKEGKKKGNKKETKEEPANNDPRVLVIPYSFDKAGADLFAPYLIARLQPYVDAAHGSLSNADSQDVWTRLRSVANAVNRFEAVWLILDGVEKAGWSDANFFQRILDNTAVNKIHLVCSATPGFSNVVADADAQGRCQPVRFAQPGGGGETELLPPLTAGKMRAILLNEFPDEPEPWLNTGPKGEYFRQLSERADGSAWYLHHCIRDLKAGVFSTARPSDLPRDDKSYYEMIVGRYKVSVHDAARHLGFDLIRILAVSSSALTRRECEQLLLVDPRQKPFVEDDGVGLCLRSPLKDLISEDKQDGDDVRYSVYDKSIAMEMADDKFSRQWLQQFRESASHWLRVESFLNRWRQGEKVLDDAETITGVRETLKTHGLIADDHSGDALRRAAERYLFDAYPAYLYRSLPKHLLERCGKDACPDETPDEARCVEYAGKLLRNITFLMQRLRLSARDGAAAVARLYADLDALAQWEKTFGTPGDAGIWERFFLDARSSLTRADAEWPAYKIFLQLAMEHGASSPVTREARRWLNLEQCDWGWAVRADIPAGDGVSGCVGRLDFESNTEPVPCRVKDRDGFLIVQHTDKDKKIQELASHTHVFFLDADLTTITSISLKTKEQSVTVSPSGNLCAILASDGIECIDLSTLEQKWRTALTPVDGSHCVFSPDESTVFVIKTIGVHYMLDTQTGKILPTPPVKTGPLFLESKDGYVVSGTGDKDTTKLRLHRIGFPERTIQIPVDQQNADGEQWFVSPSRDWVTLLFHNKTTLVSTTTGEIREIPFPLKRDHSGQQILICHETRLLYPTHPDSSHRVFQLWDLQTGNQMHHPLLSENLQPEYDKTIGDRFVLFSLGSGSVFASKALYLFDCLEAHFIPVTWPFDNGSTFEVVPTGMDDRFLAWGLRKGKQTIGIIVKEENGIQFLPTRIDGDFSPAKPSRKIKFSKDGKAAFLTDCRTLWELDLASNTLRRDCIAIDAIEHFGEMPGADQLWTIDRSGTFQLWQRGGGDKSGFAADKGSFLRFHYHEKSKTLLTLDSISTFAWWDLSNPDTGPRPLLRAPLSHAMRKAAEKKIWSIHTGRRAPLIHPYPDGQRFLVYPAQGDNLFVFDAAKKDIRLLETSGYDENSAPHFSNQPMWNAPILASEITAEDFQTDPTVENTDQFLPHTELLTVRAAGDDSIVIAGVCREGQSGDVFGLLRLGDSPANRDQAIFVQGTDDWLMGAESSDDGQTVATWHTKSFRLWKVGEKSVQSRVFAKHTSYVAYCGSDGDRYLVLLGEGRIYHLDPQSDNAYLESEAGDFTLRAWALPGSGLLLCRQLSGEYLLRKIPDGKNEKTIRNKQRNKAKRQIGEDDFWPLFTSGLVTAGEDGEQLRRLDEARWYFRDANAWQDASRHAIIDAGARRADVIEANVDSLVDFIQLENGALLDVSRSGIAVVDDAGGSPTVTPLEADPEKLAQLYSQDNALRPIAKRRSVRWLGRRSHAEGAMEPYHHPFFPGGESVILSHGQELLTLHFMWGKDRVSRADLMRQLMFDTSDKPTPLTPAAPQTAPRDEPQRKGWLASLFGKKRK